MQNPPAKPQTSVKPRAPGAAPAPAVPRPGDGITDRVFGLHGALVVPVPKGATLSFPGGVLDQRGADVPAAAVWRGKRRITLPPKPPQGAQPLPGTWLWGGLLYGHFGHFLCESATRLWALGACPPDLAGVLFLPRFDPTRADVPGFARDYLRLMDSPAPLRLITRALQVERLIVPGQGFGLGPMAAGTSAFRTAMASRFARDIAPDGPERLYISRSAIGPRRGGLLFETRLEDHLRAKGYTVFHPEKHDLATQIARYRAARSILAAEGSALHLLGMVARSDQRIGVILRRRSGATQAIATQIAAFSGRAPDLIEAIHQTWMPAQGGRPHMGVAELDFPALRVALQHLGYIGPGPDWPPLTAAEAQTEIRAARFRRVMDYQPTRITLPATAP